MCACVCVCVYVCECVSECVHACTSVRVRACVRVSAKRNPSRGRSAGKFKIAGSSVLHFAAGACAKGQRTQAKMLRLTSMADALFRSCPGVKATAKRSGERGGRKRGGGKMQKGKCLV